MPPPPRRTTTRRSPRAAAAPPGAVRRGAPPAPPAGRPPAAPFAFVFGLLVAAEDLYLGWLLLEPDPGWHWYVFASAGLALLAVVGAVLVLRGRARGWLVLAVAAVLPALLLLGVAGLFAALGDGGSVGWALLLLAGPVGALVLALGRPIRQWTHPARRTPPPGRAGTGRGGAAGR
ncbi:hypothetical protein SAMN05660690_3406 [Geodermatophilus telluris]|uniref:Uncharacterized protein n=1 Tax=Geodermatophilus telluris TaxID=1190417 RepID=A0A1G6S2Z9_9ACTN|nr:hypothetical protein [Geodermatophilus telluris]SDD10527.1 hypothetical protein SAMN05660690_3406 [Geodermatophilus telluris]